MLKRGGVIAGDSAGAFILSQILVSRNESGKKATIEGDGFGLLRDVLLNVHANRFRPRAEDSLAKFASDHPVSGYRQVIATIFGGKFSSCA